MQLSVCLVCHATFNVVGAVKPAAFMGHAWGSVLELLWLISGRISLVIHPKNKKKGVLHLH